MKQSFFFYDLETSGFNPRSDRVMQFGGQRTDMSLKPIGEPVNELIKLTEDILPSPDAVLVTGITPQKTIQDGLSEAEFLKIFDQKIATPGTIFVGFNSIRFDDEFMRFLLYRNFYDAYEWQWKDGRSRWDLLDVVRMTRALRPDGIKWPVDTEGKPANRLEMLASINKLKHHSAHDALSDVEALIDLAKLLKDKQPKLFSYLLEMRDKKVVKELVNKNEPFVYTSGKYQAEYEKTTVAVKIGDHPDNQGVLVYDLRYDPDEFTDLSAERLVERWRYKKDRTDAPLPVKTLQFNRCPAVAPVGVLDDKSLKRLDIDKKTIQSHLEKLQAKQGEFLSKLNKAIEIMNKNRQASWLEDEAEVDSRLYEGFIGDSDKTKMSMVRAAETQEISNLQIDFIDKRLTPLLTLYKARNFPSSLNEQERSTWEAYKKRRLVDGKEPAIGRYLARIDELTSSAKSPEQQFILEELKLYGESLMP